MGTRDLTAYSPRLLLQWEADAPAVTHRALEGTLVFADVSGFTRLSERLARASGRAGAEEMGDIINALFDDLLTCAARRGGEMLKYGGDAALLFFRSDDHPLRAVAGAHDMQQRLREIGRVDTGTGAVRLRMSVGMHTGTFDLFKVGGRHQELIVAGPATTETVRMEAAADAGEILLSEATTAAVAPRNVGAEKEGGRLLRGTPAGPTIDIVPSVPSPHADRFVAPALGRYLAGDVDPDHRLATVAFVHIMGIDRALSEMGPEQVAASLDETLTVVQSSLEEYGVTFLATDLAADGTKVMAAAGAPLAGDDDERRMLLALRRMVDAGTPLPLRAGANRGHVFAASVGPHFRQTFTTIGDVTNTAARVMGKAGPGEVLTLRSVLDHVHVPVDAVELPPFAAKGKADLLLPFRVDAIHASSTEAEVVPVPRLPLTGRTLELQTLLGTIDAVRTGKGALVELVGDMGSGKSRLVEELLARAGDLRPLIVRCEPYERSTPFHPIKRLLTQLVSTDPDGLTSLVAGHANALLPWLPLLAAVLDVPMAETDETSALDPRFRLERTAVVTSELLRAMLDEPTILVIEDVHWLDDASAAVLRQLEAHVAETPWLVCATCRNEPSTFVPAADSSLVQLAPLGDADMGALVALATVDDPLPPHVRDALVERAAGNPLFLTELLDHGVDGAALPESVEAVMTAQIDRLPPPERRLLRIAAVLGSRFDVKLLGAIAEDDVVAASGARSLATKLGWLVLPDGRGALRFRHQLVRDVAYESLPFRVRRDLHSRAGDALENAPGDAAERAGVLSMHYLHARRYDACWEHARIAARRAGRKHANLEAVELLERAIQAAKHARVVPDGELGATYEELAIRYGFLGNNEAAKQALRSARRFARDDAVALARLFNREGRIREREGDTERLFRWIRRGLHAVVGRTDPAAVAERAELLVFYGWTKLHQGHAKQSQRWFDRGLAEAEAVGHLWAIAGANLGLDSADVALGKPSDPTRARRAIDIYDELGELNDQAMVLINLGSDAAQQSRWHEALDLSARGRDLMMATGNHVQAVYGSFNIAEVLIDQGHLDEAEELLDETEHLWRSVDHRLGLAYIDGHRGRLLAHRGDIDAALTSFMSACAAFAQDGLSSFTIDARGRIAECHLRRGDGTAAHAALAEALDLDRALGATSSEPMLLRVRGWCRIHDGDLASGIEDLDASLRAARSRGALYDVVLGLDALESITAVHDMARAAERDALVDSLGIVLLPSPPLVATVT